MVVMLVAVVSVGVPLGSLLDRHGAAAHLIQLLEQLIGTDVVLPADLIGGHADGAVGQYLELDLVLAHSGSPF